VQLVVRRCHRLHLLFVHQFVAFLHLLPFFGSPVLEPDLDLQEETSLRAHSCGPRLTVDKNKQTRYKLRGP
jgi:hypothetical protein